MWGLYFKLFGLHSIIKYLYVKRHSQSSWQKHVYWIFVQISLFVSKFVHLTHHKMKAMTRLGSMILYKCLTNASDWLHVLIECNLFNDAWKICLTCLMCIAFWHVSSLRNNKKTSDLLSDVIVIWWCIKALMYYIKCNVRWCKII